MRSRPLLLAVTALLVVAVAVGGFLLGRGTQDPSASPPPTAGTATPSPQGSPSSTPSLRVAAAGGGTGLAPDALTRTGFPDTCAGAVQAATGYNTIGQATGPGGTRPTRAQLEQTLDAVLAGNDTSLQTLRERPFQTLTPPATAHPAWGGFRVDACNPGDTATISLFSCVTVDRTGDWANVTGAQCGTETWDLARTGSPVDWKVVRFNVSAAASAPEDEVGYGLLQWPNPLTSDERRQLLAQAGDGWTEFSDAPE